MRKVKIYDTTLRDGTQGEGINFSVADKIRIAERLDELGVHYIEGGWPGSNPKDIEFFDSLKKVKFHHAKIAAFGSTRRKGIKASEDENLKRLLEAETPVVTIFGKTWLLHVHDVIHTTHEENLKMISDTIKYLKSKDREVIYDAEHFFDGYKDNAEYALKTLEAASEADCICLCDTNGGTMPHEMKNILEAVHSEIKTPIGVHVHNDSGVAVANSIIAIELGAEQVQGTINGYGERSGNADLCSIIPNIKLKLGIHCINDEQLAKLVDMSKFVDELANLRHNPKLPYVGDSAFAHKGGMHVDAVQKVSRSFEHIKPELVGNKRRVLVSELSGKTTIQMKAAEFGIDLTKDTQQAKDILKTIKQLEHDGYEFEAAEGSFELVIKKALKKHKTFFNLEGFRTIVEKNENGKMITEATIKVSVEGKVVHTAAEGDGPVNALDGALRKALQQFYPVIAKVRLVDYKVRVLNPKEATAAKVRVLIESTDGKDIWGTVGVSENIIEASWHALVDSVEYKLLREEDKGNS
jgi:2-isopropylmalate synthase